MSVTKSFITPSRRNLLVIYFSSLIVISILILIWMWNPIQGSLTAIKSQKHFIYGPGQDKTIITDIKNSSAASDSKNVTIVKYTNNSHTTTINLTRKPLLGQAWNTDPEIVLTNPEIRLVIFSTFFGVIGASVHGIGSLTAWISRGKLEAGWDIWYLTRPPIGAALALITYLIIRAGFVTGGPTAINDFGVAGMSALVGLMEDEMTTKLRDIFDTLFGIKKPVEEKGDEPIIVNKASILFPDDQKTEVKVTDSIELKAKVINADGTPVVNNKVFFAVDDAKNLEFIGTIDQTKANVDTDSSGTAIIKIKGLNVGQVIVKATTIVDGGEITNNLSIKIV